MSLIKWNAKQNDPFKEFFELDFPFGGLSLFPLWESNSGCGSVKAPAIDIREDKKNVIVSADLPGVNKENISVNVDQNILTIRAERKHEESKKDDGYERVERAFGVFQRSLDLGSNIDQDKIKADYKNGVLKLTLPKLKVSESKQIQIDG